jgi:hypothetical protein
MAKRKPITTKELIAKLLELDPDGNRQIWVDVAGDGWYSETVYNGQIELDDNDDSIVITLPFGDDDDEE